MTKKDLQKQVLDVLRRMTELVQEGQSAREATPEIAHFLKDEVGLSKREIRHVLELAVRVLRDQLAEAKGSEEGAVETPAQKLDSMDDVLAYVDDFDEMRDDWIVATAGRH